MQRRIVPAMEIRVHSRLIQARYKGCTNARSIFARSHGHEEFKYLNHLTVQKVQKAVRAGQYHRPMQRHIGPSMEICVHSRLFLLGTKVALMQGAYYEEAMGMKSFKM